MSDWAEADRKEIERLTRERDEAKRRAEKAEAQLAEMRSAPAGCEVCEAVLERTKAQAAAMAAELAELKGNK